MQELAWAQNEGEQAQRVVSGSAVNISKAGLGARGSMAFPGRVASKPEE